MKNEELKMKNEGLLKEFLSVSISVFLKSIIGKRRIVQNISLFLFILRETLAFKTKYYLVKYLNLLKIENGLYW